jgi:hypothetical protein
MVNDCKMADSDVLVPLYNDEVVTGENIGVRSTLEKMLDQL